ncbi:hypothetical protein EVAR_88706_1 [Eumeta japonica]|uniref:Uncharacterized protein n=1 Tax=Eumeta variegata TaxID=151549 RepID=A0A4C1Y504_EUMVA|nr:hypothetical protein EVAR_88706_1 [Eumeta japonica]
MEHYKTSKKLFGFVYRSERLQPVLRAVLLKASLSSAIVPRSTLTTGELMLFQTKSWTAYLKDNVMSSVPSNNIMSVTTVVSNFERQCELVI